eukprot:scaffold11545_cov33-Attheya_sp.AAC.1
MASGCVSSAGGVGISVAKAAAALGGCALGCSKWSGMWGRRVDCAFTLVWSKCPFNIAVDVGKCVRTCLDVNSGHAVKWPASIALHQVSGCVSSWLALGVVLAGVTELEIVVGVGMSMLQRPLL